MLFQGKFIHKHLQLYMTRSNLYETHILVSLRLIDCDLKLAIIESVSHREICP